MRVMTLRGSVMRVKRSLHSASARFLLVWLFVDASDQGKAAR